MKHNLTQAFSMILNDIEIYVGTRNPILLILLTIFRPTPQF